MTLQQKLFLAFLFVVIIPIALLGVVLIELIITRSDESIAAAVDHELAMMRVAYQQRGEMIKQGLLQAASEPEMRQAVREENQATLQALLDGWQQVHPTVDVWLVVNPQGERLAQLPTGSPDYACQALLLNTISTAQPLVATELLCHPQAGPTSLSPRMAQIIFVPVMQERQPVAGLIAIDLLHNNTWPIPPHVGLSYGLRQEEPHHFRFVFITQNQEIIATSFAEPVDPNTFSPEIHEAIQITVDTHWSYRGRGQVFGETYQLAGEPIVDSQRQTIGAMFVGLPYQRYFGLQAQTGWIVVTMLIFSGVISLITASLMASAITQPIQNLIEKSNLLAGGDLSVRASVSGRDEIAQLGHAFNAMSAHLEASYQEIQRARRRALAVIEASADGIWVVERQSDGTRCISIVNSALEQMTGRNRSGLLGQQCTGLVGVCTPEGKSICATSCPFTHPAHKMGIVHGRLPSAGGDEMPVEISYGPLTNQQGELTGLVHIVRDLTLRREVEQLKDDFISLVSHELRTPLGHIKGFTTSLLQPDITWEADTQRDFLGSIDRQVDRLTKLVENLLHMSRIEAGGLKKMERHPYQVAELLEVATPELYKRANQHHLVINFPAKLKSVLADERGIEMVLANLVENAAKYSPAHSRITVTVWAEEGAAVFEVQDEGPGIAVEEQSRIFDRFYRSKITRQGVAGTGLGLVICKRIVEAHGGRIWVTSQPGQGACFLFSLPFYLNQEVEYA